MKNPEHKSTGPSRREVLVSLLGSLAVGFSAEAEAKTPDEYKVVRAEIEAQITAFAEQETNLSRHDIMRELKRCNFIEGTIPLVTIETDALAADLQALSADESNPEASRAALRLALEANHIQLPRKDLMVAQVDFTNIQPQAEAFYDTEYKTLFVDQQPEPRKAQRLSQSIYHGVMSSELNSRTNAVIDAMVGEERTAILAKIEEVKQQFATEYTLKNHGTMRDVPPELLVRYQNNIRAAVARTRVDAAMRYVKNVTALTHEAFHHFFETMFTEPGYAGPTSEAALVLALQGIRDRQVIPQAMQYAPEFFKRGLLEQYQVDLTDDASIAEFAKALTARFDFSHYPAGAAATEDAQDLIAVYRLVNEFMARIYSGALGSTDEHFETMVLAQTKDIPFVQIDFTQREDDLQYHTPNERELEFLRSMSWHDKALI